MTVTHLSFGKVLCGPCKQLEWDINGMLGTVDFIDFGKIFGMAMLLLATQFWDLYSLVNERNKNYCRFVGWVGAQMHF